MRKLLLLMILLLPLTACDQKDPEEDLSELKSMVQAPRPTPAESTKR